MPDQTAEPARAAARRVVMDPWPGQPGWGTPPQYPYRGYPYGHPPQPGPPAPPPSGATAITAAVLSFLGSAANGVGVISGVVVVWSSLIGESLAAAAGLNVGFFVFLTLVSCVLAVALLVGGILLLRRKLAGRLVIAVACGIAIAMALISFGYTQNAMRDYAFAASTYGLPGLALNLVMPAVTMTLALVPPTHRWCVARRPPPPW
ncbi:hypothetical protein [Mycobacterium talmoniae]|uniref:hypothetical protein n=1 Tax=Mycobacterium talmoniae TaxID=1858794 RepID=UPI001058C6B9|nr:MULTISPECIES: hypothetical protein [Mycobacterium]TDH57481.1 hypothetical protein E2F47_01520 [Mycobacterium eburneum]